MATKAKTTETVTIKPPNIETIRLQIRGTAPLCINRFSEKAKRMIKEKQEAGSTARGKKVHEKRDFEADFEGAKYVSDEGWLGIHAASFRCAAISACRTVGFQMTRAKLALFIEADGYDKSDGTPLVRITEGEPEMWIASVRNETGVADLRSRPLWRQWGATLTVRFDADMFTKTDVVNLVARMGAQVGVGEGRPDGKKSAGMGYGLFDIVNE